jgi:hypothetical protein
MNTDLSPTLTPTVEGVGAVWVRCGWEELARGPIITVVVKDEPQKGKEKRIMAPTTTTSKAGSKARRLILSLVMAAVSLVLLTSPASAAVNANSSTVTVDEGSLAANNGTYFNPLSIPFNTTITANVGSVSKTGTTSGTWSWSFTPDDGSSNSQNVSITANHSGFNGSSTESVTFRLNVNNVAPTATFNAPTTAVTTGTNFTISLTNPQDPSFADRTAGFTYAFDCAGDGFYEQSGSSSSASCTAASNGASQTVSGRITDKDGGSNTYTKTVTLNDPTAPTVIDNNIGLEPDRGATGVPRTTNVSATFSEEMKADTLTSTTFKLQQYNSKTKRWKTIPATVRLDNFNRTAILDPHGATEGAAETPLAANKKFRGLITTGAKDLAGNSLATNFVWTFTTGSS